jgi:hypothetical protein
LPSLIPEREIRFAVVIYGGVSLAIYINSVMQEMLYMVRSTPPLVALTKTLGPRLRKVFASSYCLTAESEICVLTPQITQ